MTDRIAPNHLPPLPDDLAIPQSGEEPVFAEPWQARIFALMVAMEKAGRFAWSDFQALLIEEIKRSEAAGEPRPYYENWLAAAERLLSRLDLAAAEEVDAVVARLRPDDRTVVLPKKV